MPPFRNFREEMGHVLEIANFNFHQTSFKTEQLFY